MSTSAGWQFAVEEHPADWRFPAGPTWLAGWIFAGENRFVTDLRAWVDDRPFLGLYGLPKPGLDERFLHRPGPPYAGFVFQLEPHRGATRLRLEARDPAGHWVEFFRVNISVASDALPAPASAPLSAQLGDLLPRLLRRSTQPPARPLTVLANEILSTALSRSLNSLPNPPFHGALEEPRTDGWLHYGRLRVTGWLAHRTDKIKRLTALVDAVQESILMHGLPRTDVGAVFADLPGREHAQFVGHVDLPAGQSAPALVKIFAELESGEKHLVFAQRFSPRISGGEDIPLPPFSRLNFVRALWALHRSARQHGLPHGTPAAFFSAANTAWAAYRAEAPTRTLRARPPQVSLPLPATSVTTAPLSVLVVTHNLNFEGAPWFVFELARYLSRQPGVTVRVLSPQEGPLRRIFTAAGMPVSVVDLSAALAATNPADFDRSLQAAVPLDWGQVDLLIANTMVSFWAVRLAHAAQKPSLLYVHESAPIRRFFERLVAPALLPLIEQSFQTATRVVFTADSTRVVFDYLDRHGNFRLLPSWVDVGRIDQFAAAHERDDLRRKHGLDPAAVLLVNIGSLCERKGQHVFLRAAELLQPELAALYRGRKIQFVMVGTRPGLYLDTLRQEAALHRVENVLFLPESGEIHDFYRLADIFVCTSFEESFPRVLLESAAFRLPIVSTNVNGIAEMLAPDEAWLIPPGDRYQLAAAIQQALAAHFAGDTSRADRARAAIVRRYHESASLPLHLALAREAVAR